MHQVPVVLSEVLLLVSGEMHQVPKQKRLHHGVCLLVYSTARSLKEKTICNVELFEYD